MKCRSLLRTFLFHFLCIPCIHWFPQAKFKNRLLEAERKVLYLPFFAPKADSLRKARRNAAETTEVFSATNHKYVYGLKGIVHTFILITRLTLAQRKCSSAFSHLKHTAKSVSSRKGFSPLNAIKIRTMLLNALSSTLMKLWMIHWLTEWSIGSLQR